MTSPYDEEFKANVKIYILYAEGRFYDLAKDGLIEGSQSQLTKKGLAKYRKLMADGFTPNRDFLIRTLRFVESVPPQLVDVMADLMIHYSGDTSDEN